MSDKDLNIHVKAQDTEQSKSKVEAFAEAVKKVDQNTKQAGQSSEEFGRKTEDSQNNAGAAADKHTTKLSAMDRLFGLLKTQALSFIGAMLGVEQLRNIYNGIIAKLERMSQLMKEIHDRATNFASVGQAIEFQTGTVGKQTEWATKAANLQKVGGLQDIVTAQQMMISADIAFAKSGGIKNPQVMTTLNQLAPFAGAAQMTGEDIAKIFEFAGTAGIPLTADAYKDFFAKLRAGFTASKAKNFGEFVIGLQKGATGFLAQGGSLEEGISAYSAARAVMPNEAVAATLLEQVTRLSGGGYERPRKAIERGMGVKWDKLTMDQRMQALLDYVDKIPESQRTQKLVAQGFPVELAGEIGKMVSPEARQALESTRKSVAAANIEDLDKLTSAFMETPLGKKRALQGQIAAEQIAAAPKFASWQQRLEKAQSRHEILQAAGKDIKFIPDQIEPQLMAMVEMETELDAFISSLPEDDERRQRAVNLQNKIKRTVALSATPHPVRIFPFVNKTTGAMASKQGQEFSEDMQKISIVTDNSMHIHPAVGEADSNRMTSEE